jgi:hypothetical protein
MNDDEKELISSLHLSAAEAWQLGLNLHSAKGCGDSAEQSALAKGLGGTYGDVYFSNSAAANAMKHCVWICQLANLIGNPLAYEFGLAHETGARENYIPGGAASAAADLHNNSAGLQGQASGATSCAGCYDHCRDTLLMGGLANDPTAG